VKMGDSPKMPERMAAAATAASIDPTNADQN